MKTRTTFTIASVAMCFVLSAISISGQMNGSFEDGVALNSGFETVYAPSTSTVNFWTVENIDYIGDYWEASDGMRSVDLNGNYTMGRVGQTLATSAGFTYQITFDMSGNPDGGPLEKTMDVTAGGTTTGYTFTTGSN